MGTWLVSLRIESHPTLTAHQLKASFPKRDEGTEGHPPRWDCSRQDAPFRDSVMIKSVSGGFRTLCRDVCGVSGTTHFSQTLKQKFNLSGPLTKHGSNWESRFQTRPRLARKQNIASEVGPTLQRVDFRVVSSALPRRPKKRF